MVVMVIPMHTFPPFLINAQDAVRPTPVKKMSMNHSFRTVTSKWTDNSPALRKIPRMKLTIRPATITPGMQ